MPDPPAARTAHVLDDPRGLTDRARSFLRRHASRVPASPSAGPSDDELRVRLRTFFGLTDDTVLVRLRQTQARYGGLRFRSVPLGSDVVVDPWPEYEAEDGEPIAWFLDLAVASPLAVWMLADGTVAYCQPGPPAPGGRIVPVFPGADALIEAEALHHESAGWTRVEGPPRPGPASTPAAGAVAAAARRLGLPVLEPASGHTECWWEADGFRLHVSRTFAEVSGRAEDAYWRLWADGPGGSDAALAFLAHAAQPPSA